MAKKQTQDEPAKAGPDLDQLKLDVKVLSYTSLVATMRKVAKAVKTEELVQLIAKVKGWDVSTKEAKLVVRNHVWGLLSAGVTVGEVVKGTDGRYQHLTAEDRAAAEREREEALALLERVHKTMAELKLKAEQASVTDQHVVLTFKTFLELCE